MTVSSGDPERLGEYLDRAVPARRWLAERFSETISVVRSFLGSGSVTGDLQSLYEMPRLIETMEDNDRFVEAVRDALLEADRSWTAGPVKVSDAYLSSSLERAGVPSVPDVLHVGNTALLGSAPLSGFSGPAPVSQREFDARATLPLVSDPLAWQAAPVDRWDTWQPGLRRAGGSFVMDLAPGTRLPVTTRGNACAVVTADELAGDEPAGEDNGRTGPAAGLWRLGDHVKGLGRSVLGAGRNGAGAVVSSAGDVGNATAGFGIGVSRGLWGMVRDVRDTGMLIWRVSTVRWLFDRDGWHRDVEELRAGLEATAHDLDGFAAELVRDTLAIDRFEDGRPAEGSGEAFVNVAGLVLGAKGLTKLARAGNDAPEGEAAGVEPNVRGVLPNIRPAAEATVADVEAFGVLAGKNLPVSSEQVDAIEQHLSRPELDHWEVNDLMIERLRQAVSSGENVTNADAAFLTHELSEKKLMDTGVPYVEAHERALSQYGVDQRALYDRTVIEQMPQWFNRSYKSFWGIE